ncbi:sulfate ABC transporter substrate-binding protein [Estrella lausannensis]|uniref:Sulfate-binding protein n=1 Tax=Estrella lausannensis TaxID=483423 RepID=A0A0H5DRB3_9BACT|nr:sulfate ABC transporter substrate-binding protein [Estrella lausannensis]CRX38718.1 Sulfate-binding protein [Estrella lausannensis]
MLIRFVPTLFLLFLPLAASAAPPTLEQIRSEIASKKGTSSTKKSLEILNVSYDPTREFYEEYNKLFAAWWKERTAQELKVVQSHGGSAKQARSVISGLEADVVSLALAFDIDAIENMTGLVGKNWQTRLPHESSPYYSTIVFLVRKGNPQGIKDWGDLIKPGIAVVMPNPKTSGGARWTYMAAWAYAVKSNSGNTIRALDYMKDLFKNAPVLDTGARGATTTFIQRRMGDVLLTWENEAYLTMEKDGKQEFEIVYPSISIQADPPVAWLEKIVQEKKTEDAAEFYLKYLYSEKAQELIAKNHFRPIDKTVMDRFQERYPAIEMISIKDFGGWEKVQQMFFKDGGQFDDVHLSMSE